MQDRHRNWLVLLLVAGILAASLIAILLKPTELGLELKGGVSLVYEGKPTANAKVDSTTIDKAIEVMRKRVDRLGVSQPEIKSVGGNQIDVALPNVTNAKRAEEEVGSPAQLYFYEWEPNVIGPSGHVVSPEETSVTGGRDAGTSTYGISEYEAVLRAAKRPPELRKNETTWDWREACTLAENEAISGPKHGCVYGTWYLLDTTAKTMLRGPENTRAEALPGKEYKLPKGLSESDTKLVHVNPGTIVVRARPVEGPNDKVIDAEPNSFYVLKDEVVLTGESIRNPTQTFETGGAGQPIVTFGFTPHGQNVFEKVTAKIAKKGEERAGPGTPREEAEEHFAIVLDEQLITVPYIDYTANPEGIDASLGTQITGGFTLSSAQNLANELQSGALPIKLELISNSQVSATLGKEALTEGVKAGIVGLLIVCVFLLLFYRVLGLIAVGGLIVYGAGVFALVKVIPITLTLPGIAGAILTIGVAADANIVIFERVKEEVRAGRSIPAAIAAGYKRGFAAILDANAITFMTAFILFALATAEVQGFALMLGIGTLSSLFTAVLATQAALGAMGSSRAVGHPALLGAGRKRRGWRFDFMGASRWFFSLSGMILLIGGIAIGARGINFGIDFKGGTEITTAITRHTSPREVEAAVAKAGYPQATIQEFKIRKGTGSGYDISIEKAGHEEVDKVKAALNEKFGTPTTEGVTNFSATEIGPTFGAAIAKAAVIAIIASLLVITIYVALRFEWKYATPVLIALAHDLLITSGVYALTGKEVTSGTVAALLTILGYSMYDTIIVFDRIRENVPRMPRAAFSQVVNRSMSEVLTRSLATSFCTLLPVASLLIFGGSTLKDFAFALLIGIASGAYSSIFIASPVLTHWKERESVYRNRRARLMRDFGRVPAYATAGAGAVVGGPTEDIEPKQRRRTRSGGLLGAEDLGQQVSKEEFDEMVRDLDVEPENGRPPAQPPARAGGRSRSSATLTPQPPQRGAERPAPQRGEPDSEAGNGAKAAASSDLAGQPPAPAADAAPEDVVMNEDTKRREKARRQRNRRHGRRR